MPLYEASFIWGFAKKPCGRWWVFAELALLALGQCVRGIRKNSHSFVLRTWPCPEKTQLGAFAVPKTRQSPTGADGLLLAEPSSGCRIIKRTVLLVSAETPITADGSLLGKPGFRFVNSAPFPKLVQNSKIIPNSVIPVYPYIILMGLNGNFGFWNFQILNFRIL